MFTRLKNATQSAPTNIAKGIASAASSTWNFFKHHAIPASVCTAKGVAGEGQAIFNQQRLNAYLNIPNDSPISIILSGLFMVSNTAVNVSTRFRSIYKASNPAFSDSEIKARLDKHLETIFAESNLSATISEEAKEWLYKYIWDHDLYHDSKDKELQAFLQTILEMFNGYFLDKGDLLHFIEALKEQGKKPTFIDNLKQKLLFLFPNDLNWKGMLVFWLFLPFNVISVLFQSIAIIGFTKSFMQITVPLVQYLTYLLTRTNREQPFINPDPKEIENDFYVSLACWWFFIFNLLSNFNWDLNSALNNSHDFAKKMQDPTVKWKDIIFHKAFFITFLLTLLTVPPISRLAKVSTESNLGKIPFFSKFIPDSVRNIGGFISSIAAGMGFLTTKIPSLYKLANNGFPALKDDINKKLKAYLIFFTVMLGIDTLSTASANFTATVQGFANLIKEFDPATTFDDKNPILITISAISGLLASVINGIFTYDGFTKINGMKKPDSEQASSPGGNPDVAVHIFFDDEFEDASQDDEDDNILAEEGKTVAEPPSDDVYEDAEEDDGVPLTLLGKYAGSSQAFFQRKSPTNSQRGSLSELFVRTKEQVRSSDTTSRTDVYDELAKAYSFDIT